MSLEATTFMMVFALSPCLEFLPWVPSWWIIQDEINPFLLKLHWSGFCHSSRKQTRMAKMKAGKSRGHCWGGRMDGDASM